MSNERERKSVGEQETFEIDTLDATFVLERARALVRTVWSRLEGHGFRAFRTVTVTVRFENFITFARSRTGREAWTSEEALCAEALELLLPFLDDRENPRHRKLRLIGVRANLRKVLRYRIYERPRLNRKRVQNGSGYDCRVHSQVNRIP